LSSKTDVVVVTPRTVSVTAVVVPLALARGGKGRRRYCCFRGLGTITRRVAIIESASSYLAEL